METKVHVFLILIPLLRLFVFTLHCCLRLRGFASEFPSLLNSVLFEDLLDMAEKPNDEKSDEQRPLGAVLGWLNLSPTLPNTQDNMPGMTAGRCADREERCAFGLFSLAAEIYQLRSTDGGQSKRAEPPTRT